MPSRKKQPRKEPQPDPWDMIQLNVNTNEEIQTIIAEYGRIICTYLHGPPVGMQDYANDMIKFAQRIEYFARCMNYGAGHGNRRS